MKNFIPNRPSHTHYFLSFQKSESFLSVEFAQQFLKKQNSINELSFSPPNVKGDVIMLISSVSGNVIKHSDQYAFWFFIVVLKLFTTQLIMNLRFPV